MSASRSTEISPYRGDPGPSGVVRRLAGTIWAITTILAIVAVVIVIATLSTPAPEAGYLRGSVALFALACFAVLPPAQADCREGCDVSGSNTFLGNDALLNNLGGNNTAVGANTLFWNTAGSDNTAVGYNALINNNGINSNESVNNTAIGVVSLQNNTTGHDNTAAGVDALGLNTTGIYNTAVGAEAGFANSTGSQNTAIGYSASVGASGDNNVAVGTHASAGNNGSNNIALGPSAGVSLGSGSNNIDIGSPGAGNDAGKIRIGTRSVHRNTFIAGISGVTVPTGVSVLIDNTGHLGTATSSARFKDDIKPMDKTSEAILALKPVTFRYKQELDPEGIPQFGLVAEEVQKVNPNLVVRDEEGKPYSVRYEQVNAMLLNEFLKEHRKVEELEANAAQQQRNLAEQQKRIDALNAGLQKVSVQLELNKPRPQTVLNNQ